MGGLEGGEVEDHERVQQLLPGLALGILEEAERAGLEEHLQTCQICRGDLQAWRQDVRAMLERAPAVPPPPRLKGRVLGRIRAERSAAGGWLARLGLAASVVLLLAGSLLAWQLYRAQQRLAWLEDLLGQQAEAALVLGDPQAARIVLSGEGSARGATAVLYASGERGAISVQGMPSVPQEMVYQVWVVEEGQRASAGTFRVGARGAGLYPLRLPQELSRYEAVGVTLEPAPGSPSPTGERVLLARLR